MKTEGVFFIPDEYDLLMNLYHRIDRQSMYHFHSHKFHQLEPQVDARIKLSYTFFKIN